MNTLKTIDFSGGVQVIISKSKNISSAKEEVNNEWFNGEQEPVDLMIEALKRQKDLEKLTLTACGFSKSQKKQIREALPGPRNFWGSSKVEVDFGDPSMWPKIILGISLGVFAYIHYKKLSQNQ